MMRPTNPYKRHRPVDYRGDGGQSLPAGIPPPTTSASLERHSQPPAPKVPVNIPGDDIDWDSLTLPVAASSTVCPLVTFGPTLPSGSTEASSSMLGNTTLPQTSFSRNPYHQPTAATASERRSVQTLAETDGKAFATNENNGNRELAPLNSAHTAKTTSYVGANPYGDVDNCGRPPMSSSSVNKDPDPVLNSLAAVSVIRQEPAPFPGRVPKDFEVALLSLPLEITDASAHSPTVNNRASADIVASIRPAEWNRKAGIGLTRPAAAPTTNSSASRNTNSFNYPAKAVCAGGGVPFGDSRQRDLPASLQFDPAVVDKPVEDEYLSLLIQHASLSSPLLNGWTLFSHQKLAILRGLRMRRTILGLDMGLGKTLIACVWAKAFQGAYSETPSGLSTGQTGCKVIVVCPVSLKTEWVRTAVQATGLRVQGYDDAPDEASFDHDGSESADDESPSRKIDASRRPCQQKGKKKARGNKGKQKDDGLPDDSTDVYICSWSKIPLSIPGNRPFVVICDEAHAMQSITAGRTKDVLQLVPDARCVGVLLLTGTPMKNGKPSNLFPLLRAIRHPLANNQRCYETRFCAGADRHFNGKGGRPVWQANGCANLGQLQALLAPHLLHLTKEDCLKELPPQTRISRHVPVSHHFHLKHAAALQKLADKYIPRPSADGTARENSSEKEILGLVGQLRYVGSMAKVDAAVQLAQLTLETEPAVVIFTSFVESARAVHGKLCESGWNGELLTGETPVPKRQPMVDAFQQGLSPVIVCTFGVGGVGLTLTCKRTDSRKCW
jgi:SNF2-related domain